jgi:hypothetical protein
MSGPDDLDPKDAKIVTLARSSRAPALRADARCAVQAVHVPEPS